MLSLCLMLIYLIYRFNFRQICYELKNTLIMFWGSKDGSTSFNIQIETHSSRFTP